jgi:membrane protein DedA with SNARE-associated domain
VFVLLAGVAKVPISQFVTAVALGRGFRYFAEGWLAVRYGEQAETLLVENGAVVSLALAGTVAVATIAYFLLRNRNRAPEAT